MDCGKTVVFFKEWNRLCDGYCDYCIFGELVESIGGVVCNDAIKERPEDAVTLLQKWSDAHPLSKPKTYADVFFEKFPKASKDYTGKKPFVCRHDIFGGDCQANADADFGCCDCWLEPYPEQEVNT